ncbi:MAG TPA: right-handed parallel beta-helix repeat-containing protein [Thermoanaerobaculia bacterium]|jgi:hypothetical protein
MIPRLLALALASLCALPALASAYIGIGGLPSQWEVVPGDVVDLYVSAWNQGPDVAHDVVVTIGVLPGSVHELLEAPAGWTCAMGDPIVCTTPAMAVAPGYEQETFRFRVTVGTGAFGNLVLPLSISASNGQRQETIIQWAVTRIIPVTTTADSGDGSFRAALDAANFFCAGATTRCRIVFNLAAPAVIEPLTPLPPIISCGLVHIDGAPGAPEGDRAVELSGSKLTSGSGLVVTAQCADGTRMTWIDDLAVNRFPGDGIAVAPGGPYEVRLNGLYLGTDVTGTLARPNGSRGIGITSPFARVSIGGSIVSGNARSGIWVWDSEGVYVASSKIGVGADGRPLGNGASGIFIRRGVLQGYNNVVAYNAHWGISASHGVRMAAVRDHSIHSNGVIGYDFGVDYLTLDESATNSAAPVITSATYDAATGFTTVTGTLRISSNRRYVYEVHLFSSATRNAHGFVEGERWESFAPIPWADAERTAEWTIRVNGDLRGRILSAVSTGAIDAEFAPVISSEFSLPLTVP